MKPKDYPRPNIKELPGLYAELDSLIQRVETILRRLPEHLFEPDEEIIHFEKMTEKELRHLIATDPSVLVIAFTRVCGLSDREFYRLYGLKNVYSLRDSWATKQKSREVFIRAIMGLLAQPMRLETFLYTFYKMWEEHQKRHFRGRFEKEVHAFFRVHGYRIEKLTKPTEVNGAIPPSSPQVVMQIRTGVRKDLVKRAKEFSSEFDESIKAYSDAKFLVIFKIPSHQLDRREEIREVIIAQRRGKRPYDGVFFQDELERAIECLQKWNIPKNRSIETT